MIDIIDAISVRLDELFGDTCTVYLEQIEQGVKTPCFFIVPVEGMDSNMIANRKYRSYLFAIQFLPDGDDYRKQFAEVSKKLFDNFDYVTVGDIILPTFDRTISVNEDVLTFRIEFKYYHYTDRPDEDKMENLEMSVKQ